MKATTFPAYTFPSVIATRKQVEQDFSFFREMMLTSVKSSHPTYVATENKPENKRLITTTLHPIT